MAGAGLSLMIIPLVNVVIAAVPRAAAGGAGGTFSTAQQIGGALGVAVVGGAFFSHLGEHSFTAAFKYATPIIVGLFLVAALLSLVLPDRAASEEEVAEL